jgi:hypothetical protein
MLVLSVACICTLVSLPMFLQERQFYLEKLEAIERLCMLAGTSLRDMFGMWLTLEIGNTSVNRGGGVRLAVADAVLDVRHRLELQ